MKKIITSYGFISTLKWNGEWFSDHEKRFSRIILPQQIAENQSTKGLDIESFSIQNCSFLKQHIEDSYRFDKTSYVLNLDYKFQKFYKHELNDIGILWAYKDSKFAFVKYYTIGEVLKISKN